MPHGLYVVDFHAHLQDCHTQDVLCRDERDSLFFKHAAPTLEQIAHRIEPMYAKFSRSIACHFRDSFSRYVYRKLSKIYLMEVLRLFKVYGVQRLLNSMERNGVDHVVIHSLEPLTATDNIIDLLKPHRDKFSIFASVDRNERDPVGYFSKFLETGAISGLKLHPIVGGFACGELYHATKDLVAYVGELGLPTMIHTGHIPVEGLSGLGGCNEVRALEPLLAAFPKAKFVLAHIGWESWRQVIGLAEKYKNVSVETSWQPAKIIRRAVDTLGPERVIFGSDFPLFKQDFAYHQMRQALTEREFVMVASVNAVRLLGLKPNVKAPAHAS